MPEIEGTLQKRKTNIPERGRSKLVIAVSVSLRMKKKNKRRQLNNMNANYRIYLRDRFQQMTKVLSLKEVQKMGMSSTAGMYFHQEKWGMLMFIQNFINYKDAI